MKKIYLIIFSLLLTTVLIKTIKPNYIHADNCVSSSLCVVSGSDCKSSGFDCNNSFTVNSKSDCDKQSGCFESVTCSGQLPTYYCFLKANQAKQTNQPLFQTTSYESPDKIFCDSSGNATTDSSSGEIYTAIGCIPVSSTPEFISWILGWAIGIGGGIALILIIVATFQIMMSSGNPEKVQAGKELLTSAIAGLIMLIFSIFILKVIGVDILKLPGLK